MQRSLIAAFGSLTLLVGCIDMSNPENESGSSIEEIMKGFPTIREAGNNLQMIAEKSESEDSEHTEQ